MYRLRLACFALAGLLLATQVARADPALSFFYAPTSFRNETNPQYFEYAFLQVLPVATQLSGNYYTPDGQLAGSFSPGTSSGYPQSYASFAQLQAGNATANPWTLSMVQDGVPSVYQFKLDLSGIDAATLPALRLSTPTAGPRPTFQWTESGTFARETVQVYNRDTSVHYSVSLPVGQTSWTVPANLPAGDYTLDVQLTTDVSKTIPLLTSLLVGPGISMPTTSQFAFNAEDTLQFTVAAPEPASLALLALGGPALLARRRRHPKTR